MSIILYWISLEAMKNGRIVSDSKFILQMLFRFRSPVLLILSDWTCHDWTVYSRHCLSRNLTGLVATAQLSQIDRNIYIFISTSCNQIQVLYQALYSSDHYLVHEPAIAKPKGRLRGSKNNKLASLTQRDPSSFELPTQRRQPRRGGQI